MSWSKAGNEFQEKRCLFCAGAHIPYTSSAAEIAPHLHPASARACSQAGAGAELTESPVPPFLSLPRHGKPDQHQAQGLSPAPASAEGVQLLPEQRKGLGFTGCVICDSALCLGDSSEPRPGSAVPFLPVRNAPVDIEGKLFAEFLHSPPSNCWSDRGSEKEREFKAGSALVFWAISTSGQL